jgi:hypothetical protein
MQIDTALNQLIDEFGQTMRLSDLKLDNAGGCAIRLDKKLVINLQCRESEHELWFYADMGAPVTGSKIYADLLRGNLFWSATFGATLSLSGDDPAHIIMTLPIAWQGMDGTELLKQLEIFVNAVEEWSQYISTGKPSDIDATESAASSINLMLSRA